MTLYHCDARLCPCTSATPLEIKLTGYRPAGTPVPELCDSLDFCSHACFVRYMSQAMKKELKSNE